MRILLVPDTAASAGPGDRDNELETILDGVFQELKFRVDDPETPGKKKFEVKRMLIRRVSIQAMEPLGKAWGKPKKEVAVYLDIDPDRVAQLTDESFMTAMSEGRRLNFTSFGTWWKWQTETLAAMGQDESLKGIIKEVTEKLARE